MDFVPRAQWGARPPKAVNPMTGYQDGIFVHYTAGPEGPDEAAALRSAQAFHMDSRGWNDLAYSWAVGQSGRIYEGRGWGVAGGHTEGYNRTAHAVVWIGNDGQPSPAALASINVVVAEQHHRYGPGPVRGHQEVNRTSCPGPLQAWLAAGRPSASPTPPEDIVTPQDIAAVAELAAQRTMAYLANPSLNPGTVVDPGARAALAAIHVAVADPTSGIRALLLQQGAEAGAPVDVDALAETIVSALGKDLATEVVATMGAKLLG